MPVILKITLNLFNPNDFKLLFTLRIPVNILRLHYVYCELKRINEKIQHVTLALHLRESNLSYLLSYKNMRTEFISRTHRLKIDYT